MLPANRKHTSKTGRLLLRLTGFLLVDKGIAAR